MYCAFCEKQWIDGLNECPDCGTSLMDDDELDTLESAIEGLQTSWVLVYTTNTVIEAEMLQANLKGANIPVQILSQVDSSRQFTVGSLATVKIYVLSVDADDALAIIRDIEQRGAQ